MKYKKKYFTLKGEYIAPTYEPWGEEELTNLISFVKSPEKIPGYQELLEKLNYYSLPIRELCQLLADSKILTPSSDTTRTPSSIRNKINSLKRQEIL